MATTDIYSDDPWSTRWWSAGAEGELPADLFVAGKPIKIGATTAKGQRTLEWKDGGGQACSMTLTEDKAKLGGSKVEIDVAGKSYECAEVEVYATSTKDGSIGILVGFLGGTGAIGTGNAGAFIAQAGPITPPPPRRPRTARPKR